MAVPRYQVKHSKTTKGTVFIFDNQAGTIHKHDRLEFIPGQILFDKSIFEYPQYVIDCVWDNKDC